jgi:hypothetical protein
VYKTFSITVGQKDQAFDKKGHLITTAQNFSRCDIENLANMISNVCNDHEKEGFKVISIIPITKTEIKYIMSTVYPGNVTDGVIITFYKE